MNDERDFTPSRGNRDLSLIGTRDVPARSHEHQALRLLQRLYFFRVASSAVWIAAIIALKGSFDAGGSITLIAAALAAYPALDGLVTLIDLRIPASASVQKLLWCNLAAGLTAAALEVVPSGGIDTKIRAFGLWAVASGAVQMLLGASRQPWLSRQWLMIISGAGSVLAGHIRHMGRFWTQRTLGARAILTRRRCLVSHHRSVVPVLEPPRLTQSANRQLSAPAPRPAAIEARDPETAQHE